MAERPSGTYQLIYAVVRRIPRGRVATYGQVAALAGFPRQPRLAGYALHALRDASAVPWHRVLNAQGRLSLMRSGGGAGLTQRLRLEQEGVQFTAAGRVDLKEYGWRPESQSSARQPRAGRRGSRPQAPRPAPRRPR
jgi:methylated-DNA-protein-cysteine methyltransferase-like protein